MTTLNDFSDGKLRVVIDSSVYVAAALKAGLSEEVVLAADRGVFISFTSKEILSEVERVLRRLTISNEKIDMTLGRIRHVTKVVAHDEYILGQSKTVLRDPNDGIIIACAAAADASVIVSLDKDLLDLKTYGPAAILHPATFRWMIPEK